MKVTNKILTDLVNSLNSQFKLDYKLQRMTGYHLYNKNGNHVFTPCHGFTAREMYIAINAFTLGKCYDN